VTSTYPRLVADIGGSNARFGWIDGPQASPAHVRKLPVRDYPEPADAARAYLDGLKESLGSDYRPPRHAAMAVATAVSGDQVVFTNSHWSFSRQALQAALGLQGLQVLNDFEALALALPRLGPGQLRAHGAMPMPQGAMAVIGPGTGLGVAGVVQTAHGWVALPGEGGHSTLAPADDFESELLQVVRAEFNHVSGERLLSGIGLPVLHRAVAHVLGAPVAQPWTAENILEQGLAGRDEACRRCLDSFCSLLGSFAGSVALIFGARGGVYIGGGIVPRMEEHFFASAFRERFEAKGRLRGYLEAIPTALITDTLVALTGSAAAIDQQVG
jgi:glucokinase